MLDKFAGEFAHWEKIGGTGKVPSQATLHCTDGDYDPQGKKI